MNSMLVPKNLFDNLEVLAKYGRESNIYISSDYSSVYKIYKNSSFEKPIPEKIYQLFQKQDKITKTVLPDCLIFTFNDQGKKEFIGLSMKYFKDYISIDELDKLDDVDFRTVFLNLIYSLKELTDNNIYPTDLNDKNILVSPSFDIQIIDLDGEYCIVSNKEENDKMNIIFDRLLFRIISHFMDASNEISQSVREKGYSVLRQYGYDDVFVKMLEKKEPITYEKLTYVINHYFPKKDRQL